MTKWHKSYLYKGTPIYIFVGGSSQPPVTPASGPSDGCGLNRHQPSSEQTHIQTCKHTIN